MRAGKASVLRIARRLQRGALDPLLSILFPTRCFGCGGALGRAPRLGACAECWAALCPLAAPLCAGCAAPLPRGTDLLGPARGRCAACVLSPPPLAAVRAAVLYDEIARRFLLRAKLGKRPEILSALGAQLARAVALGDLAAGCSAVLPVPAHFAARLRRGFNPALELARPVAHGCGLPLRRRWLARRWRSGGSSKKLGARERSRAVAGAFVASPRVRGQRVLLVDDVLTTGATLEACARALREAGACEVRGAVWARSLLREARA